MSAYSGLIEVVQEIFLAQPNKDTNPKNNPLVCQGNFMSPTLVYQHATIFSCKRGKDDEIDKPLEKVLISSKYTCESFQTWHPTYGST